MKPSKPDAEAARLAALNAYRLLDTPSDQSYDDLTGLAAYICQTPMALMVLLDAQRQWFKSRVGIAALETPRERGFCAHAVLSDRTLIIEDAAADERFAGNPLVTGEPHIRFYAGALLMSPEGHALGTLCVIDRQPRQLKAEQLAALEGLARQIVAQMELRRVADELSAALQGMRELRSLLPICAWCKNIRNDAGYWSRVEEYLHEQTGADLTHGICPDCAVKMSAMIDPSA